MMRAPSLGQQPSLEINEYTQDKFNGSEYMDKEFNIVVEAGPGTQYSELQQMSSLNSLLQMNMIDVKTYIQCFPDTAMPNKHDLIRYIEIAEQNELKIVKQQLSEALAQNQQMAQYANEQDKVINDLERRLDKANRVAGDLQKEYTDKINSVNQFFNYAQQQAQKKKQQNVKAVQKQNVGNNVGQTITQQG